MGGTEKMRDVAQRFRGQQGQRLRIHLQHVLPLELRGRDVITGQLTVRSRILAKVEHVAERELGHDAPLWKKSKRRSSVYFLRPSVLRNASSATTRAPPSGPGSPSGG